jgi:hypothetical protein
VCVCLCAFGSTPLSGRVKGRDVTVCMCVCVYVCMCACVCVLPSVAHRGLSV